MMRRLALVLAALLLPGTAFAAQPAECLVAEQQLEHIFPLPQVARAIAAKKLNVLVVGAGSSTLPGPKGAQLAYPARLQQALTEVLPGVAVKVATDVKAHRTAAAMVKTLIAALAVARRLIRINSATRSNRASLWPARPAPTWSWLMRNTARAPNR
jgi:hypothetical protein